MDLAVGGGDDKGPNLTQGFASLIIRALHQILKTLHLCTFCRPKPYCPLVLDHPYFNVLSKSITFCQLFPRVYMIVFPLLQRQKVTPYFSCKTDCHTSLASFTP